MDSITRYLYIKDKLYRMGFSHNALAKLIGVSITMLYRVIRGQVVSRPVAGAIEKFFNETPGALFPYVLQKPLRGPGSKKAVNE